jgi:hypothetical protein
MMDFGIHLLKMKRLRKYKASIIVALIGAAGGFCYWLFIGCASGNCSITANWETSTGVGALMGWLVGDMAKQKK